MSNGSNASDPAAPPLIGNPVAVAILARALRSGRVAHAYLFHGPKGVGKATAARLLASAIQCDRLRDDLGSPEHPGLIPCGACESCRRVAAGTHPDVLEVTPDTATGQNISVKQACAVVANVALRPKSGARRVYVVPNAELLHEDAANTLLKTLEEPGEFATLILCSPSLDQVLPTIRSRCQPVRFDPVPPAILETALVEWFGAEPSTARAAAVSAGGRPGMGIAALRDPECAARRQGVADLLDEALAARARCTAAPWERVSALRLAEEFRALGEEERQRPAQAGNGEEPPRPLKSHLAALIEMGQSYVRDILVLGAGAPEESITHLDRRSRIKEGAAQLEREAALGWLRVMSETAQLLDRNVAPQLALERMFLHLISPGGRG